jgi:hypothetical protein
MRFLLPAVLVIVLISSAISSAAEAYTSAGSGTASCGAWTAARRDRQALNLEQWILGFLTGVADLAASRGVTVPGKVDPLNGVDVQAVWAWVDNFCHAHPLETVIEAGEAFATERSQAARKP